MRTFTAALALLLSLSARADDPRAVYMDAVRTMMPRERYDAMIEGMYRPLVASAEARTNAKMPPESVERLKKAAQGAMTYDELLTWTADAYQRHFTPDEMKQLLAFYRSPLGVKMEREQPKLQADVMRKVADVVPQRMETVLRQQEQLKKTP
ncbi:MAG TPA: DUF2059 domain-containing protein [Myxococcales bacterium]|jgi:hypothetical protein|nr:DUF2059 domain-containing protein [Myxococcales bacterium]